METIRLTVTIPEKEYKKIEDEKRKKGINRSALVQEMIGVYFKNEEERQNVARYIEGYRRKPEKASPALDKAQAETLGEF